VRPGQRGDYEALLGALAAEAIAVDRVLHLRTYGPPAALTSLADLEDAQRDGAADVLALVQALAAVTEDRPVSLLVIGSHTHRRAPGERVAYERAPVRGLVKSITHEWPRLAARHVDLPPREAENAARVRREADGISKDWEVVYRDGARLVRRLEEVRLAGTPVSGAPPWKDGDLILLTGGLGGVGAVLARHLLEQHQARLVIVGRTSLDSLDGEAAPAASDMLAAHRTPAELRKTLAELERAGGAVVYEVADVADGPQLQAIVARAEARCGARLAGVIHLAGAFPTRLLAEETTETLWDTLRPKLGGAFVLGELLRGQGFFLAFDTVYSFFGGVAVGAYAAANAGVAAFVEDDAQQRASYAWSHWDETGMSRGYQLRAASLASGYSMIRPRQGLHSLLAGLAHGERDLVVGLDPGRPNVRRHLLAAPAPAQRLAGYVAHAGPLAVSGDVLDRFGTRSRCDVFALDALPLTATGELDRASLEAAGHGGRAASADRVLPRTDLERTIAAAWREVLGLDVIDVNTSFFTLGGQSILLIQLLSKLKRSTGRDLTVVDLFRHPTVSALAAHLGTAEPAKPTYARAAERAKKQQEAARQRVVPRGRAGERTGNR
jgi:NAD(P)-dependent dehydrogenase (short-subunit alcohol dehydrogenase family)/aryl carrier-like protein